jgi:hypothetical protein
MIIYYIEMNTMNRYLKYKASRYKMKDEQAENERNDETDNQKRPGDKALWYFFVNIEILTTLFKSKRC